MLHMLFNTKPLNIYFFSYPLGQNSPSQYTYVFATFEFFKFNNDSLYH